MLPGRTTALLVGKIIEVAPGDDVNPFMDIANEMVTEQCQVVFPGTLQEFDQQDFPAYEPAPGGFVYTAYRLELIERWLAAHFYAVFSRIAAAEKAGDVSATYQGKTALGLDATVYGQQVKRIDSSGALAVADNAMNKYSKFPKALGTVNFGAHHIRSRRRGWSGSWWPYWGNTGG